MVSQQYINDLTKTIFLTQLSYSLLSIRNKPKAFELGSHLLDLCGKEALDETSLSQRIHPNVLTSTVSKVSEKANLRRFERRPLSRQYIPQRSHGPRGITFSPDIERRANKDLMSLQLLQIHIKDRPSNNVGRQVGKVDDRVGGEEGVLITWVVPHPPPHRA